MTEQIDIGHAPHITVYSKAECSQCDRTIFMLERAGATHTVVKIDDGTPEAAAALAAIKALGFMGAPVVVTNRTGDPKDDVSWSGLIPDKVKEHALGILPKPAAAAPTY